MRDGRAVSAMDAPTDGLPDGAALDDKALARAALARVLASDEFVSSPRLTEFLRFVVEATLAGRADEIKGYTIAVEALGRPSSFDPQTDPIVRVEATRLRRALERYYASVGPEETLDIVIPKGSYVPQFKPRGEPVEPGQELEPPAAPPLAPALPAMPRRPVGWVVGLMLVVFGIALGWTSLRYGVDPTGPIARVLGTGRDGPRDLADRLGMPILDVRPFETVGSRAPTPSETHAIEARLRDSFARFDFVDVMEPGQEAQLRECREPPPRSVFALTGLAEGREDGTFSLLVRLSDRCEGTIVWTTAFENLKRGADMPATEERVVRDIAVALMQSYSVLPTRARAQARADAAPSGFGCIAQAYANSRTADAASSAKVRECLDQEAEKHTGFALAHAAKAHTLLCDIRRHPEAQADPETLSRMLREAELAADLAPTSAYAAKVLATVDYYRGESDAALAAAERALALNPLDFDVSADMGTLFIGLGKPDQGEALLAFARSHGALKTPLQDAFLGVSAFLRDDSHAAGALVTPLQLHPTPESRVALALTLHTLGRLEEEREVVSAMARETAGGAAGVRRVVQGFLPLASVADPVLSELEAAGLAPRTTAMHPRG